MSLGRVLGYIVVLSVLLPLPASGSFFDGNRIYDACSEPDDLMCIAYVIGLKDGVEAVDGGKVFCIPRISGGQVRDIFFNYLRDNPSIRHHPASVLFLMAMAKHYKCR